MSASPDRSVRPAQRGDEAAIARLQLGAWRSLTGGRALDARGITEGMLARQWEATLAAPRPAGSAALIALHANTIVGFALAGPDEAGAGSPQSEPHEAEAGEATQVYELVVDPDFRRTGHASRLLAAIADLMSGQLCGSEWKMRSASASTPPLDSPPRARFARSAIRRSTCGGRSATKGPRGPVAVGRFPHRGRTAMRG